MAYGFRATNGDNETVINDQEPLAVLTRTGSVTPYQSRSGIWQYRDNAGMLPVGTELPLTVVPIGSFIMRSEGYSSGSLSGDYSSNMNPLNYAMFGPRTVLPNPTGYGAAVYNSDGNCVWDSTTTTARIVSAGRIPAASMVIGFSTTIPSTANAIYMQGGTIAIWNNTADRIGMRATRTSSSIWTFSMSPYGTSSSGSTTTFAKDFHYLFAEVA